MRLIIAGSRTLDAHPNPAAVCEAAMAEAGFAPTEIVSGGARGADRVGEEWARAHGVPIRQFLPDWRPGGIYNPRAGFERNQDMADYATALLALWDGSSRGTADMIRKARRKGLQVHVFNFGDLTRSPGPG